MPVAYTEDKIHGPEVDFGVAWRLEDGGEQRARVTWVATDDNWTRGNVIAYWGSWGIIPPATRPEPRVLAWNIPLFVVEHLLSQPYGKLNFTPELDQDEDTGWATACIRGEPVDWVAKRLRRWEGCEVVHYSGKDYQGGITKAAKAWAAEQGYTGRHGGWIYDAAGEARVQGWFAFAASLRQHEVILCVKQEWKASEIKDGKRTPSRYTETWIVSQESAGRRDF